MHEEHDCCAPVGRAALVDTAAHVSWNDALAYCGWTGRGLPTEAQCEAASRGGREDARYPWRNGLGEPWRVNIWQGTVPGEHPR